MNAQISCDYIRVGTGTEPERIYYESVGEGKTLVFIHAGFLDRRMWEDQIDFFTERGYRVVRYDVRGFGKSDLPRTEYSDFGDLKMLFDKLSISKATLIGISNGGRIALDFAVEYPDMVEALVLGNSGVSGYKSTGDEEDALWTDVHETFGLIDRMVKDGKFRDAVKLNADIWGTALSDDKKERLLEIAIDNYHSLKPSTGKMKYPHPPSFGRLGKINVPVLILVGKDDLQGSKLSSERIHSMIKNSKLVTIENAGHILNMSQPGEFNEVVSRFLSEVFGT